MLKLKTILQAFRNNIDHTIKSTFEPESEMGKSRINLVAANYTAGIIANLVGGNFFAGLMLLLNADDLMMGTIAMIGFIGNTLQILSPFFLERFEKRKKLLIIMRIMLYILNIGVISLLSVSGIYYQAKMMAIMVVILLVNILSGILSPGLSVWHIKCIPDDMRVKYFSFYSITNAVIQYAVVLGVSKMVDGFKENGNEMLGLQILRIAGLLLAIVEIYFMSKIKEYPNERAESAITIKQILLSPFKEKKYLLTVLISCLWTFSANIPGPYYTVYLLRDLNVEYSYLNLINMLNIPLIILFTPVWSRRINRTSWFKTLYLSMGIYLIHLAGLAFVNKATLYYLYPACMIYAFIFAPGINLVFSNAPYINLPAANQTNYIGFYAAMSNLAAFAGTSLGREFIKHTEGFQWNIFGASLQNKQTIVLLSAAIMLVSAFIIKLIHKKTEN